MFETHPSNRTVSSDKKFNSILLCISPTQMSIKMRYRPQSGILHVLKHPNVMKNVQGNYFKVKENGFR